MIVGKTPSDPRPRQIDAQNRVVLPSEVMKALGVNTGDYVMFEIAGAEVRLHKVRWVLDKKSEKTS